MAIEKVVVIDDDPIVCRSLELQLKSKRLAVSVCTSISEAERCIAGDTFDLMFVDIRLPDGDGTDLLNRLAVAPHRPLMVMMTGYGTIEAAVTCIRAGAFDYIIKPFTTSQIDVIIRKADNFTQAIRINEVLIDQAADSAPLIGETEPIRQMRQMIQKVAPTEATVLIIGENGTGKELVAREIFRASGRNKQPFIKVNCAAISETLIESEFFGHEKGSFTGASEKREGRFELANNGTILLDEISEVSLKLQAKLLRVLQEREFERVGGNRTLRVNVRVLATTNRNLEESVKRGEFRQDLYYRLNVFPVFVPPLRQRKQDISQLTGLFLERISRKHGVRPPTISADAIRLLSAYDWPGNVRELQNVIERAVILAESGQPITAAVLAPLFPVSLRTKLASGTIEADALTFPEQILPLEKIERQYIHHILQKAGGNRTQAAQMLGISIRTLRNKLNQAPPE